MNEKRKRVQEKQNQIQNKKTKKVHQDQDSYQLRLQKMEKQITILNLDIKSMLEEKSFKQNVSRILIKQKKTLQSTFLYKDLSKSQAFQRAQPTNKNCQKDSNVNVQINNFLQMIESNQQQTISQTGDDDQTIKQNTLNSACQSKHLKQIFNPQDSNNTKQKANKLRQKLSLMYQKIKLNLQKQQPYLHEKILQRIKRQAKKYSCTKLLNEIQKLIKQNSQWINQQTNMVNTKLQQQSIEEMCVNNLSTMKKIMNKKVSNNDFIYQNYCQNISKMANQNSRTYPVEKVREKFKQVLKKIQQNKIQQNLNIFTAKQNIQNTKSIKQFLKDPIIQDLLTHDDSENQIFYNHQQQMLSRLLKINLELERLAKK